MQYGEWHTKYPWSLRERRAWLHPVWGDHGFEYRWRRWFSREIILEETTDLNMNAKQFVVATEANTPALSVNKGDCGRADHSQGAALLMTDMQLRDWFAGQLVAALLAYRMDRANPGEQIATAHRIAEDAYVMADAMMAVRLKEKPDA